MAVASEFCELYENATELGRESLLLGLARTLPRLHTAGVALPFPLRRLVPRRLSLAALEGSRRVLAVALLPPLPISLADASTTKPVPCSSRCLVIDRLD